MREHALLRRWSDLKRDRQNVNRSQVNGQRGLSIGALVAVMALGLLGGCAGDFDPVGAIVAPFTQPSPREAAIAAVNRYDADERARGVTLLANANFGGETPYVRLYRMMMADDPDATVRAASANALGRHGGVEHANDFVLRLKDESPFVRWEAAKALQKFHHPPAARALIDTLRDDLDVDVRMASAIALGQYAQPAVFDALVGALSDREFGVVSKARNSLKSLTGVDLGSDGSLWVIWAERNTGKLFEHQETYLWHAYRESPGWTEKVKFWKEKKANTGRPPKRAQVDSQDKNAKPDS